jgi:hypothetical protein
MIVVDYSYYTETYGGAAIAEGDFNAIQTKATVILDSMCTAKVLTLTSADLSEDLLTKYKMCVCNICDAMNDIFEDGVSKGIIKSEKIGSWSTTYAVKEGTSAYSTLMGIINLWLSGTFFLCMWV